MNRLDFDIHEHFSHKNTSKLKNTCFCFNLEFVNYSFSHIGSKGRPYEEGRRWGKSGEGGRKRRDWNVKSVSQLSR